MRIFFDVDGVIIDGWHSDPALRKPWDETIEQDLGVDKEAFRNTFFKSAQDGSASLMDACIIGRRDLKDALSEVLPALGYSGTVDAFIDYWFRLDSNLNREVLSIVGRLKECEGVELFLATSQEHRRAAYLWHDLRLKEWFHDIYYSARLGLAKSDASFFEAINRQLDIAKSDRPIFFDDRELVVAAAIAAGWDGQVFRSVDDILQNNRIASILRN